MRRIIIVILIAVAGCKTNDKSSTDAVLADGRTPKQVITKEGISLELYDYEGFEHFLNKDEGKTYVVNFWATWCKPCVEELPYFEQLHTNYKNKGVEVILVSLDMPRMIETQLIPFMKKRKLQSEVIVFDDTRQNMWIPKIDEEWSGAIPATLIYNSDKRSFYEQSFEYEELENQVLEFLN